MVESVRAWHPAVPHVREVLHADFDHAYPAHTHDAWTVLLIDAGAVDFSLGGSEHRAAPESIALLPPGIPHDGHSAIRDNGYRKRVLYLEPDWLPPHAPSAAVGRPTVVARTGVAAVRRIHAALGSPGDQLAAEHWMLALRHGLLGHLGAAPAATPDAPLARRLRTLLDDRLTETFTLAEAGEALGAHPSHLVRAFSHAYGIAPHRYVTGRRVDLARRLLLEGRTPADSAALAGFHDQAHLTRHFRRTLGVTPGSFARAGGPAAA
ncbi:AraC family transcriptional regulator [Leifsonia sp. ZF2019]|uniref:helix-turn-helix transcriptional regulator n=1 Tax=Leifsonia sp. ZF2019 TaxID=2781978 RepID=UPI001CC026BB|nr:AraC family transcriptional regulator [Leifsonia sp. ZF2019]UAJ79439.1 AraC family transcriptional regulator [Leifsonia sp. ZF2019]